VPTLRASFSVDTDRLKGFGIMDPRSANTLEIFKSGKLSSDERLYLSLWGSTLLSSITFEPKRRIITAGETIEQAYLVVSGTLVGTQGDDIYRFGPGAVLGLAEGVINQASKYSVITATAVQARVIPLHRIDAIVAKLPLEVRSILQTVIKRTLALP
jgi:CRP-like cAMP-binding protein